MLKKASTNFSSWRRLLAIFFTIVLVALVILVISLWSRNALYAAKYFPNTWAGPINLGGLDFEAAQTKVNLALNQFEQQGLAYQVDDTSFKLIPNQDLAQLDSAAFLSEIWQKQHSPFFLGKVQTILTSFFSGFDYDLPWQLNNQAWQQALNDKLGAKIYPAAAPRLTLSATGTIQVKPEIFGQVLPDDEAHTKTLEHLQILDNSLISLHLQTQAPDFTIQDISPEVWTQLNKFVTPQKTLTLVATKNLKTAPIFPASADSPFSPSQNFVVAKNDWVNWLELNPGNNPPLTINQQALDQYLTKNVAGKVEEEPSPADITMTSSTRASKFSPGLDGWKINLDATAQNIINNWLNQGTTTIPISLDRLPAATFNQTLKNLGITELLGVGQSNFKGSPVNRRHNIAVGAQALQGLIIKPGEEFSLIQHLLPVDGTTGYLPELVIKGDKTIPEFGGGLCQIGTTLFRSVLASGLPVLERRNHSYRVVYYEPAGTDATIYDPQPDMRFKNDTSGNILIWTQIKGDNAYFQFWGTPDGRVASQTTPIVSNITSPGPGKIIVTPDLAPGAKKCTEKAHAGADARFTYSVNYANGSSTKETFYSHYVPWPSVCLVGATSTAPTQAPASTIEGAYISDLNQKP